MKVLLSIFICFIFTLNGVGQNKYDYTWTFGNNSDNNYMNRIYFSDTGILKIDSVISNFDIEGDKTFICNRNGDPVVLFTNCSVLDIYLDTLKGNHTLRNNRQLSWCYDPLHYSYPFDQTMLILPDVQRKNILDSSNKCNF